MMKITLNTVSFPATAGIRPESSVTSFRKSSDAPSPPEVIVIVIL
jgi:hypothetical protein